jgi:hypothetical protein
MDEQTFVDSMETLIILKRTSNAIVKGDCQEMFQTMPIILSNCVKCWTQLDNLLEVKNSCIHGKGVFAKVNLEADQVVSFYPCDGVIRNNYLRSNEEIDPDCLPFVHNYKTKLAEKNTFIFGNPDYEIDGCLGHFINDSYDNVEELKILDQDNISNCIKYLSNGLQCNNCVFVMHRDYVYVKTLKPIAEGEELISSYGYEFWCINKETPEIHQLMKNHLASLTQSQQNAIRKIMKEHCHVALKPSEEWVTQTLPRLLSNASSIIKLQSLLSL